MTFGILTAAFPGRAVIRYAFTPADVIWTARYVAASSASGESDYARRRDLVWRLLERFAVHAYRYRASGGQQAPEGRSFRSFMRQYFPSIPRTPWNALPAFARGFAIAVGSGRLVRPASSVVSIEPVPEGYGGWNRELEGDGGDAAVQTPPPAQAGNTTSAPPPSMSPPPDAGAPPPPAQPTADVSGMDASAMSAPPPPMPDGDAGAEPPEEPGTYPALDGNQLVLSPWLLNGLVGQRRRRHHHRWPYATYSNYSTHPGYSTYPSDSGYPSYSTYRPYTGYQTYRPYGGYHTYRPYGGYQTYRPYATRSYRPYGTYSTSRPYAVSSTYRPYATSVRPGTSPYRPHSISSQIARLAQSARHIGTLRQRSTGRSYPVFGGNAGARNFRLITRPVGGRHFEIMSVQSHELESELATAP